MSASRPFHAQQAPPPLPPPLDEEEILVTSPTSYALRESLRRSSSSSAADFAATAPALRSVSSTGDFRGTTPSSARGRASFFSRAPPPPPPQFPPAPPLARPSSNPSLSSMDAPPRASQQLQAAPAQPPYHGHSLGPTSFNAGTAPYYSTSALSAGGGSTFSHTAPVYGAGTPYTPPTAGASSRRSSSRRSLFSRETFAMLNRDKDVPVPTIPEGAPQAGALEPIKCEGYLTKRGHLFTNWKTRYFTLRGNVLEYFSGDDKSKKYGAVTVAKVAPWSGETHGFMFYTAKQIPYYVYASSASERAKWMRALQEFVVETEDDVASCEGYLTKRGHLVPSQRAAYYVLSGTVLRHYLDQQAYRENQSALAEVEVRSVAPWDGEPHGLMFQTVTGNVFYASADTQGEQQKWLATVKKSTANLPEPVACAGYLTKQGHKRKSWKKRYFILRGSTIAYYSDFEAAGSAKGKPLAEVTVEDVQRWDGEPFGFMFMTSEQVPYYVYADNDRERNKWMNALRKLNAVDEEPEAEKKRCPNCSAVLTGSRFCGACGFNLRGTTVKERARYSAANAAGELGQAEEIGVDATADDLGDQMDLDDENTPFDELEALSEGARTLLLAVMQTPDGIDVPEKPEAPQLTPLKAQVDDISAFEDEPMEEQRDTPQALEQEREREWEQRTQHEQEQKQSDDEDDEDIDAAREAAMPAVAPAAVSPVAVAAVPVPAPAPAPALSAYEEKQEVKEMVEEEEEEEERMSPTPESPRRQVSPPTPPRSSKAKTVKTKSTPALKPNFAIVAPEPKPHSFTSFSDSEEESKAEPAAAPKPVVPRASTGLRMGAMGMRKTTAELLAESSSDEEDENEMEMGKKPVAADKRARAAAREEKEEEEDEEPEEIKHKEEAPPKRSAPVQPPTPVKPVVPPKREEKPKDEESAHRRRSSSGDSLELDTRGISAFEEPPKPRPAASMVRQSSATTPSTARRDLYAFMEHELNFTPQFVPSAESPVRCRIYTSMAYTTAKKVLLFLSDSGPMGVWKQDPDAAANAPLTIDHKWSMLPYLNRAQDEGYGIITCNPFSNSAVVYEAGGFERVVPIPNSSTPQEHVLFVWEHFVSKCRGQVSVIAFARGGALVKSILETFEDSARDKLYRVALIESRHEIDHNESPGVLELLGRRSINWEASYEPLGAQIVDSQARVNCVCLSLGFMPSQEADNTPKTLEKGEDPAFAFVGANPEQPGMTAVVKHVRAELRRRKNKHHQRPAPSMARGNGAAGGEALPAGRPRRHSNIVVIGETDAEESSDLSTGDDAEKANGAAATTTTTTTTATATTTGTSAAAAGNDKAIKATYYLPKPVPRQQAQQQQRGSGSTSNSPTRVISDKDFELLKVVGQGGFGKVFLCRKVTAPQLGECYAMKVLKKQQVVSSGLVNTTMAERKILTEISHPFVVKLHYAFQSESRLYLVMDYLSGGSLATHLRRRRKFPEEWARFYAAEVAAAIAHLHSANIIYRDAKLENVLMDHEGHVRITDFGLSKVGVSGLKGATTFCGTAAYIAPELLRGKAYGKAADWWSFGILLYEMIGGKPPYYHRNRDIMFQTILKQDWVTFSPNFSDDAIALINGLLTRDPTMRLGSGPRGADEVLTHPFFDSINWPALLERKVTPPFNPGVGKLDTHYAPRNMNEITARDREGSVMAKKNPRGGAAVRNDFDGFSFVGRPSSLS